MFVTISNLAQHVGDSSGELLILSGLGRESTLDEIQHLVDRLSKDFHHAIARGDSRMLIMQEQYESVLREANQAFEKTRPINTNPAMYAAKGESL